MNVQWQIILLLILSTTAIWSVIFVKVDSSWLRKQSVTTKLDAGQRVVVNASSSAQLVDHDGCGLIDNYQSADWVPFDAESLELFRELEPCLRRLDVAPYSSIDDESTLRRLQCVIPVDRSTIQSVVSSYRTIHFLGDSVLRQQFLGLVCALQPDVDRQQVAVVPHDQYEYHFQYDQDHTTVLTFRFIGFTFDKHQTGFTKTHYPAALNSSTVNDAIVLNAASHYSAAEASIFRNTLRYLANRSMETPAPVFYMEPHGEEWPTSNGAYAQPCFIQRCGCQYVNEARLQGHGWVTNQTNFTAESIIRPDFRFFVNLPNQTTQFDDDDDGVGDDDNNTDDVPAAYQCIPDCMPPSWKVELARSIFLHTGRVHVVPLWWQFIGLGMLLQRSSTRRPFDCTHKDVKGVMAMNEQLIRAMVMERQNKTIPA